MKKGKKLIGKRAFIKNPHSCWYGHWGYIQDFDGDHYHIGEGTIQNGIVPIFERDEFVIKRNDAG